MSSTRPSPTVPDGLSSAGQFIFAVEDSETDERIGDLWLAERDTEFFGGNKVARSLYRSLGYAENAVWMGKEILLGEAGLDDAPRARLPWFLSATRKGGGFMTVRFALFPGVA